MEAVILILKHATFLCHLGHNQILAPTQAELIYQRANIDLKIQQFLMASSQNQSVKLFADFIIDTGIGLFMLASVKIISYQFDGLMQTWKPLSLTQAHTQTFWSLLNYQLKDMWMVKAKAVG